MTKKKQNNILEDFVTAIFKTIGLFFIWISRLIFNYRKNENISRQNENLIGNIKEKWIEVEQMLSLQSANHTKQAIFLVDNLIDAKLKQLRISGETMGERLKNATRNFSWDELQNLWNLHKLRNEIAHNANAEILYHQAKMAIEKVKRVIVK